MGHYYDGKDYYADTDFLNSLRGVMPGMSLEHMGFGEFQLVGPKGTIDFDRMRGKQFTGQSGRSHKLYDNAGGKLVKELITQMEKKGKSERAEAAAFATEDVLALVNAGLIDEAAQLVTAAAGPYSHVKDPYDAAAAMLGDMDMIERTLKSDVMTALKKGKDLQKQQEGLKKAGVGATEAVTILKKWRPSVQDLADLVNEILGEIDRIVKEAR